MNSQSKFLPDSVWNVLPEVEEGRQKNVTGLRFMFGHGLLKLV